MNNVNERCRWHCTLLKNRRAVFQLQTHRERETLCMLTACIGRIFTQSERSHIEKSVEPAFEDGSRKSRRTKYTKPVTK